MKKNMTIRLLKTFFITTLLLMNLVACEKDDIDKIVSKVVFISEGETVENIESENEVEFICSEEWTAETDVDWITIPVTSGEKGKIFLAYIVAQNTSGPRSGTITVKAKGGAEGKFTVTQRAGQATPTETNLYVKVNGEGLGTSWADASNLDYALSIAEVGNIIHIAEGTYIPTKKITNGDVDADITFEISKNIKLIGGYPANATQGAVADHATYKTILSGDEKYYHVVSVTAVKNENDLINEKVVLQGLTITKSKESTRDEKGTVIINDFTYYRGYAGGIIIGPSNLEVLDCEIVDNKSGLSAAMYAYSNAIVKIERTKISRNVAEHHTGGFWARGGSIVTIIDSEVTSNRCVGVGAGLYVFDKAEMYVYNTVVADNFGDNHGVGLYVRQNAKANVVNVMFANNSSPKGSGGGIFLYQNASINLINSTITANSNGSGGGLFARNGGCKAFIANSIISGNTSLLGGPEFGYGVDGDLDYDLSSSIIGNALYNTAGEIVQGIEFNPSTMLDGSATWIYKLVGTNNPAKTNGLSSTDLINLGNTFTPVVEGSIMSQDLLHNSRVGVNVIGAVIN